VVVWRPPSASKDILELVMRSCLLESGLDRASMN